MRMMGLNLLLYKMTPSDPLRRQVVASIPVEEFYYMHGFAISENYAMIVKAPIYFKNFMSGALSGK